MTQTLEQRLAEGPGSRELDARLWWLFNRRAASIAYWNAATGKPHDLPDNFDDLPKGLGRAGIEAAAPHLSTSVDDALAMVQPAIPGYVLDISMIYDTDGPTNALVKYIGPLMHTATAVGKNPLPRAICLAILRAHKAKEEAA